MVKTWILGENPMLLSRMKIKKRDLIILSYVLSTIIFVIVYLTGGTRKVYTNLMYIPISIISSTTGIKRAVIHAIYSGLLVGPVMPMNVEARYGRTF